MKEREEDGGEGRSREGEGWGMEVMKKGREVIGREGGDGKGGSGRGGESKGEM